MFLQLFFSENETFEMELIAYWQLPARRDSRAGERPECLSTQCRVLSAAPGADPVCFTHRACARQDLFFERSF